MSEDVVVTAAKGPCDQEPCKSLLETYNDELLKVWGISGQVKFWCGFYNHAKDYFTRVFMVWFGLIGLLIVCKAQFLEPLDQVFCSWITYALYVISAMLVILLIMLAIIWRMVMVWRRACVAQQDVVLRALTAVFKGCPRECWPPFPKIDCEC